MAQPDPFPVIVELVVMRIEVAIYRVGEHALNTLITGKRNMRADVESEALLVLQRDRMTRIE